MPTTVTVIFFILLILFLVWFRVTRATDISFLSLITRHPDEAYDWFMAEECWRVVDPEAPEAPEFSASLETPETPASLEFSASSESPASKEAEGGGPGNADGNRAPFTLCVPKLGGRVVTVTVYGLSGTVMASKRRFVKLFR
jgi:hypothetical protein